MNLLGDNHPTVKEFNGLPRQKTPSIKLGLAMLQSVRDEVDGDWIGTVSGLISGEVFTDFLEMAQHLWDEGYKDAAAVIAGSSLEGHLKRLAQKANVAVHVPDGRGGIKPKTADLINADLVKGNVYDKVEQKQVTAWLGVRNEAAHGNYTNVLRDVVGNMIDGIRLFILRHPA